MACVRYLKSGVDGYTESKLYNDLRDSYSDYVADHVYNLVYSDEFSKSFGEWRTFPEKFKNKLDKNGEPRIEFIAPTPESNKATRALLDNSFIYPTAVNGLFPRNKNKTKGALLKFARENKADIRVIGDYVSLDGRSAIPSNVFYHDGRLVGAKPANIANEKAWLEKRFGNKIDYKITKRLVDGHAMGKFQKGAIYMYENASEGIAFHEAFHATSQMFLTKAERTSLYEEVRRRKDNKDQMLSDAQVEEMLADEFTEYIQSDGKYIVPESTKEQKNFFSKLLDMIKEFFFGKNPSVREVYENINAGKYAKRISLSKRALKFLEGSSDKSFYKTVDVNHVDGSPLKIDEKKKIIQGVNKYFMDKLFTDGNPEDLFKKDADLNKIYEDARAAIGIDILVEEDYASQVQAALGVSDAEFVGKWEDLQNFYLQEIFPDEKWSKVVELHKKQLVNYGIVIEEVDREDSDQQFEGGRNNFVESVKYDTKDGAPRAVKVLVGTLTKKLGTQTDVINDFGMKELVDFNTTYDFLARNLAGLPGEWSIFESKLYELADERPEFIQLIDRLSKSDDSSELLRTQFVQAFSKTKYNYVLGLINAPTDENSGDIVFIDGNSSKLVDRVKDNWRSTFYTHLTDYGLTMGDLLNHAEENLNKSSDKTLSIDDKQAFLNAAYAGLGFTFTDPSILSKTMESDGKKESPKEMLRSIISYARDSKATEADDLFGSKSGVGGRIKQLAELEAKDSRDIVELQHINAEGQTVYGITLNNYMTLATTELNYISSLATKGDREKALVERMPHIANSTYSKNSLFLKEILNGKKISISVFDGFKYNKAGETGKATKDLGEADKYSQFFNGTLKGHYSYLRAADRGIENIMQIEGKKGVLLGSKQEAYIAYTDYLYDEMLSAKHLNDSKEKGDSIAYYRNMFDKDSAGLRVFSDIIQNKSVRSLVTSGLTDDKFKKDFDALSSAIEADFDTYFDRRLKEERKELERLELISKTETGKWSHPGISNDVMRSDLDNTILAYIYNHQAAYIEQTKLFVGDLALYKNSDDAFKRFSMTNSTKKISRTGADMNAYLDKRYPRLDGKISSDRQYIKTIVYEDVEAKAQESYINNLTGIFKDSLMLDGFGEKGSLNKEGEAILEGMLDPYLKMDEGDAAGFITLDEYRDLMVRAGDWLPEHDAIFDKLQEGTPLTSDELFYVQPLKTQYTGPLVGQDINDTGVYVHSGYKHALTPLLPAMYKDSTMKKLMDHMTANQVGISQFRSGNKFGTVLNLDQMSKDIEALKEDKSLSDADRKKQIDKILKGRANEFYNQGEDGKNNINTIDITTQTIDYKYMGIQLEFAPKVKEKITAGTQLRKLMLANLFNHGGARSEEFEGYVKEYIDIQKKIIAKEVAELFDQMSISPVENGYKITDGKALVDYLAKAAKGRNVSDNVLAAIEGLNISTGELYTIDTLLNKDKVENLLMALVNNSIIKEKRSGGSKAQVPSSGYELKARSKNGGMFTSNELEFYRTENGELEGMEIAIPAPKELLKQYGSLDALNDALKAGDLDSMKEIVGFRIPTQGMNSADLLVIKKFLPAEMGDIVVMPTEIVAKAGSDYDIDKLNIYFYASGKLSETDKLQNDLLDVTKNIMKHKDNWRQLLAPISDHLPQTLVKDVRKLGRKEGSKSSTTNIVEGKTNMEKFKYFLSGKAGVGQTAVHITHHVLTQIADTYVASPHAKLFFKYNETEIDNIRYPSLGGIKDQSGNWITETLSAFLNSYVDIAKDPYIFDLNAGNETANTIFYMLRLGAEPKWLARFMAQPSIQNYIKNREISKSEIIKKLDDRSKGQDYADSLKEIGLSINKKAFSNTSFRINEEIDSAIAKGGEELLLNKLVDKANHVQASYITPSMTELKRGIETIADKKRLSNEDKQLQKQFLDNFLDYQRQSGFLQKFIRATSPDTKGVGKSINTLLHRQKEKSQVLDSGFFGNAQEVYDNTFIGEFQNAVDAVTSAYSDLTITQHPAVKNKLDEMKNTVSSTASNQAEGERARSLVENEFIRYVVNTANLSDGKLIDYLGISMTDNFNRLMSKNNPNNTVRRIQALKNGTDKDLKNKLQDNLLIRELIPILDREKQDNIKIFSRKVNTAKENDLTEAFAEIYNLDPALGDDIAMLTFLQSGTGMSPITFTKFVPMDSSINSSLQGNIKAAIKSIDWGLHTPDMDNYEQQFYRNNMNKVPNLPIMQGPDGTYRKRHFTADDSRTAFPFMKKRIALEKNKEGKVTKWGDQLFTRTAAPKDEKFAYEYIATDEYSILGDGIYLSDYKLGKNKQNIFETEDALNCIKGK